MGEIGLDSKRNGELAQAKSLDWQIRTAFREGCAGAFAFAWTDEWYRGGESIFDWDFGLTTRSRKPKPALAAVTSAMNSLPICGVQRWPSVSVVVCTYNGAATIRDTLDHLAELDYPDYEVIVVNDGSTDSVPEIAAQYDVRLISTRNQGLGQARNEGLAAARGEIIAYIDDDAYPTKPWLRHLARAFIESEHTCIGGPNFVPAEDGWIGQCVADSPGGPLPVLLTDELAEHVPGCNMAFRRERLQEIGGFDPLFRAAGDDVDICWRVQDKGWTIGFAPAAMVWHHRRATIKRYWRQQVGYGKAESLLERKWPGRFSALGHMSWSGKIYGRGLTRPLIRLPQRIYWGQWGLAPYQRLYHPPNDTLLSIAQCPEWLIPIVALAAVSAFGFAYPPLGWALVPTTLMLAISLVQAIHGAFEAKHLIRARNFSPWERIRSFGLTAFLHLLQPIARLWGRIKHGLTPWRLSQRFALPMLSETKQIWSETWRSADTWLNELEAKLMAQGALVSRGGDYDECDFRISGGMLAVMHVIMGVEDHAQGKQYLRFRSRFDPTGAVFVAAAFCLLFSTGAVLSGSLPGVVLALAIAVSIVLQVLTDCSVAAGHVNAALHAIQSELAYVRNDAFRAKKNATQNSPNGIDCRLQIGLRNIE
jgi:GT2 family glycosyltransferase